MGLLGDFLSKIDSAKRIAADRVGGLLTDPGSQLSRMGYEARDQVMPFIDAAERGDIPAVAEGLLSQGVAGPLTFAGAGAKTADKAALAKAQAMAKEGADPITVWQTTGWTDQFPDKKWRFEIPDNAAKFNAAKPNPYEWQKGAASDVLSHKNLYSAYPELGGVHTEARMSAGDEGRFTLNPVEILAQGPKPESPLLHELQHAIQEREGFARGGSPDLFYLDKNFPKFEISEKVAQSRGLNWDDITKEQRRAITKEVLNDHYRRLAGEAEARLTQQRMNLTPEQRRMQPPWLSFDLPPEQQIIKY